MHTKRDVYIPKETCMYQERPIIEICLYENIIRNGSFGVVFSGAMSLYQKRREYTKGDLLHRLVYTRKSSAMALSVLLSRYGIPLHEWSGEGLQHLLGATKHAFSARYFNLFWNL